MSSSTAPRDAEIERDTRSVRAPLERASHIPSYFYTSPEIFRLEQERLFLKDWLCVGRVEEIADPGNYFTFKIIDEPIVVARAESGEINAFSNLCAHRGVEVAEGRGTVSKFSCPYHAWTYDLSGRL